ncbi:MAG: NUDIX domain-containing protein [Desulfobulbaceae bacterium]|nr:NUDIX domain-containing protein [Desulfobulbaceae bacterium]
MQLAAGIIIMRRAGEQKLYLILRAYNYWDFPKGEIKAGETPFEAALRETEEETGLKNLSFPWGRIYKETEPYRGGKKKARYYLAETTEANVRFSVNPEIGRPEHHEFRWLTSADLKNITGDRLHPVIDWARQIIEA